MMQGRPGKWRTSCGLVFAFKADAEVHEELCSGDPEACEHPKRDPNPRAAKDQAILGDF